MDAVNLSPEAFATLVAPAIDRVFRGGMRLGWECGGRELVARHGGSETVGWLIEFRTALAWPGREVSPMGFAAVTRYRDAGECSRSLAAAAERGALELTAAGGFRATDRGHEFLRELYEHQATAMAEHWAGHEDRVERLLEPAGRVLDAAQAPLLDAAPAPLLDGAVANGRTAPTLAGSGGGAFAAMAPPCEPAGTCPAVLPLNRLGTLRYHRADAHAAAWTAAGLTAAGVAEMAPGPERDAIEAETNRRAAFRRALAAGAARPARRPRRPARLTATSSPCLLPATSPRCPADGDLAALPACPADPGVRAPGRRANLARTPASDRHGKGSS